MGHTYTSLLTHIIFRTKDRLPYIRDERRDDVFAYIGGIVNCILTVTRPGALFSYYLARACSLDHRGVAGIASSPLWPADSVSAAHHAADCGTHAGGAFGFAHG